MNELRDVQKRALAGKKKREEEEKKEKMEKARDKGGVGMNVISDWINQSTD